jgi:predicted DNA-binding protein
MSTVVRLPDDLYESASQLAAIEGRPTGDLLSDAYRQYLHEHKDRLAEHLEDAAKSLRAGTPDRLPNLTIASSTNSTARTAPAGS